LEITDVTIAWRTGVSAMPLGVVLVGIAIALGAYSTAGRRSFPQRLVAIHAIPVALPHPG
jgi:hypothetical protein